MLSADGNLDVIKSATPDSITKFGCEVNIKSMQEEESNNMGQLIDYLL